jgi:hypothetical protein
LTPSARPGWTISRWQIFTGQRLAAGKAQLYAAHRPRLAKDLDPLFGGCPYCSNPLDFAQQDKELTTEQWIEVFRQARAMGSRQPYAGGDQVGIESEVARGADQLWQIFTGQRLAGWTSPNRTRS